MTASNRTLEWAEVHLDFGYCPVPTIAGTKGACIPWKPWQTQRPTLADLVSWWPDGIRRNIALVCGVFHGLVVVDADDEEAVRFSRLQFAPTPYRVRTRRGLHFYYRHPGEGIHIQTKAKVYGPDGPAVDVRGDGGMATALGSVHQSGHIYRLDEGGDMLSALDLPVFDPSWVPAPKPLQPPTLVYGGNRTNLERAERYLDKIQGAGKGGRNQHTFRVAAAVVRDFGLSEEQGWALLSAWNATKNDPPLPEDELKIIVHSCLTSGRAPIGAKLGILPGRGPCATS